MSPSLRLSDKAFAAFARFHSATMVPIYFAGQSWPGFSYTEEERDAMRDQFARFPNAMVRFYMFLCLAVPIIIALFVIPVLIMVWVFTALQHAHGGTLPTLLFFAIFGATMAVNLAIMLPLGYYLSCLLYAIRSNPTPADAQFGRRLFFKYCRQVGRVALFAGFGCLLLSLWPENASSSSPAAVVSTRPLSLWQRSGIPLAAIAVKAFALRYYYLKGKQMEKQIRAATAPAGGAQS